jgi:hypothetical protein
MTKYRREREAEDAINSACDAEEAERIYASAPRTRRTWRALQDALRRFSQSGRRCSFRAMPSAMR